MPTTSGKLYRWIRTVALGHPRWVLAVAVGLTLVAGVSALGIRISTSRYGLVSRDNPYQRRLLEFFDRFGAPDTPVVVVEGADPDARRTFVDRLEAELAEDETFSGRVLGRLRPTDVAEVLFLQEPGALHAAAERAGGGARLRSALEGGLEGVARLVAGMLEEGLSEGAGGEVDVEAASRGLSAAADLVEALDAYLGRGETRMAIPAALRERMGAAGLDPYGYLGTADGTAHVVQTTPDLPGDDAATDLRPVVERLRAHVRAARVEGDGIEAHVTGLPALAVDELTYIGQGLYVSSLVAAAGIVAFCLVFFRSVGQSLVALVPLGLGVVWTLGAVRWIYGELNLITSSFVAVLLGLGIDFAVHLVARANEEARNGASIPDAAGAAVERTGPGIGVGAFVTALAFLSGGTTEFTAYGELGVLTAVGLLLIFLATMFVAPPLFVRIGVGRRAAPALPGLAAMGDAVRRAPRAVLLVAAAGVAAGVLAFPRIAFNSNYFSFLPEDAESARGLRKLEGDPVMSPITANLVAEDLKEARRLAAAARKLSVVGGVMSPSDFLPPLDARARRGLEQDLAALGGPSALAVGRSTAEGLSRAVVDLQDLVDEAGFAMRQAGRDASGPERLSKALGRLAATLGRNDPGVAKRLRRLEDALAEILTRAHGALVQTVQHGAYGPYAVPRPFRRRFVAKDGGAYAVYVTPAGDIWDRETGRSFAEAMERLDPDASGLGLNRYVHEEMIIAGFRRAAALSAVLIFLVLWADFRSLSAAAAAAVPTLAGWAWMLAVMAATGLAFDPANIVSLPLVIGIGVAYGVHMVHRRRGEALREGGRPELIPILRGTGSAVVIAAWTTMVGFGALMVVDYGAMKSFGAVMVLGIAGCLLASLVVLPALWVLLRRVR